MSNETHREQIIEKMVIAVIITLALFIPYLFTATNIFEI